MAGERLLLLLLLLLATALALQPAAPAQSASAEEPAAPAMQALQHTFKSVKHIKDQGLSKNAYSFYKTDTITERTAMSYSEKCTCHVWKSADYSKYALGSKRKISVHPTSSVQISSIGTDNLTIYESHTTPFGSEEKKEEKTLRSLVDILQDMIQDVPTQRTPTEQTIITPKIMKSYINGSIDSLWLNVGQKYGQKRKKSKQKAAVIRTFTTSTTTPFWSLRTGTEVSVVLHTNESSSSTTPLKKLFFTFQNAVPKRKSKTFDQLTNGSLENLVQSLKNVRKLKETENITKKPGKLKHVAKVKKLPLYVKVKHKPLGEAILEKIEKLKKLLQKPPDYVKQNPHLKEYVESSESYITKALRLEKEAEASVDQLYHQPKPPPSKEEVEQDTAEVEQDTAEVEQDTAEVRKLRAFINLLYDFSPQLTTYIDSSAKKNVPEDISEKAIVVLDAVKHVFCGTQAEQNKKVLKKLLEDDIKLLNIVLKNHK